jgi:two-component system, chemotaxis family, CheB/CheR fusion protein
VDTDPRYSEAERAAYASVSTRAGIGIPLVKEGQLVAILGVNQATPRQWSDFDIDLSSDVAERTWAALERARAEAALRESEELQRLTIELVPALLWSASPDGEEVSLNEGWLTYTGQSEAETQHFGWLNAIHPDDLPAVRASFQHAFATGEPLERQHRIKKANDGWRWHLVRHVPVRDDGDNITGWFGAAVDIHEGNFAEQALRDSEERFRQFSEASSDVLWIVDASSRRLEFLSAAFDRVWGVPRATVMNDQAIWATMLHPDDREQALTAMPRALAGEQVIQEYRIIRGDGAIRYITDVGFPIFGVDGSVVRVGGIAQDLTERRQAEAAVRASERRQRALIDGLPQLVWRAFDGGHWTWASPQWTEFTGQAEADSHGWGWLDLVHPDDRDQVKNIWGGAIERGEFHADYRVFHGSEGRYRWFQTRATPVRDDQGVIVEWLGTSTDVDDLRQMQERQQALVAELQHRTRNLMGVVRSMANRTGETSTGYEDFRERFRDRLEALARVQGLLSRLNETDRISFDELVGTEIKAMSHASERVALDGPSGIRLRSSMVQTLAMALHELATNAVKYGALGQSNGHLAISWRMVEPDRRGRPRLRIEWRETCVKMPPLGAAPQGGGQGRELIEKALPYQLSAETSFELGPDGVHCTITIPVSDTTVVEDANV